MMPSPQPAASDGRSSFASIAIAVAAVAGVLLGCWLLYRHEAHLILRREGERESLRVALVSKLMQSELRPVAEDLRLLADGDGLRSYLETGSTEALRAAIRRARFASELKPAYDQIRFIDQSGQEILRVNQGGRVVEPPGLQNKSERAYFRRTAALPAGAMYMSAFDLNVENGQVEHPLKPTLRLAVPVFDAEGRRRGIYIINYLGATFITHLQEVLPASAARLRLLNADGYWLKGADPSQQWTFMLPDQEQFSLRASDPALWQQIRERRAGQWLGDDRMFTWARLTPAEILGVDAAALSADDRFLVIASDVEASEWPVLLSGLRQMMLIVSAALLLLALTSLWFLRRWRTAMQALREANRGLEQGVIARTAELARSNEILYDREELLEETGRLAKVGGWELDPVTETGRWTEEVARIHDLDPAAVPNKGFGLGFYPGESRTRLEAALARSLADGTPYDLELEFISASGQHKWVRTLSRPVLQDGRVVRMRGALQDVTDRKLAELRLQAQLQRLHLLEHITRSIGERQDLSSILQVAVSALESDLPADFCCIGLHAPGAQTLSIGAVASAGNALAQDLGIAQGESLPIDTNGLARSIQGIFVYEPEIADIPAAFPQRLARGGLHALVIAPLQTEHDVFGVMIAARRRAGSFSSGECEFLRQLAAHVALAAHQARLRQELQAAYDELRATQQAVMQQERLRVLGQMASGIAHDINNAISPVMLYTDSLLENETALSDRTKRALETIRQAVSDVADTVARMREFYRQREPQSQLTNVRLNDLLGQVIELTRARWQAMPQQRGIVIELRTELAEKLPEVHGIESEIREALTNLIFNAVDAMPEGGILTLRTRIDDRKDVAIEVCDSGSGMDEDTRRRCLEPFFTTKGERGTGLGLAMVFGIMQRHGGSIDIESAPGAGTTVRLRLKPVVPGATAARSAPRTVRSGLNLLLIDDDPNVLKSLRETLEQDGHAIATASGGAQGIEMFRAAQRAPGARPISAVITDLGMPHVDGRAVAAAIKAASPQTPVILLTGWGERLLAEGSTPEHVDRLLSKPPRLHSLREALADLVGE